MKPKTATTRTRVSDDSFERPAMSMAYSVRVKPYHPLKQFIPGNSLAASSPIEAQSSSTQRQREAAGKRLAKYTFLTSFLLNLEPPDPATTD